MRTPIARRRGLRRTGHRRLRRPRLFCDVATVAEGGDHRVIISRILRHEITDREPLVFCRGTFMGLGPARPMAGPAGQPASGNPATTVA